MRVRGGQYGWAVDYETAAAAQAAALHECGAGCSVVLTFGRRGAYAADQDADSTAVGLQRSSHRGRVGSRQGGAASDPAGAAERGLRPWGCGRSVRSADAGGDSGVAVGARTTGYLDGPAVEALRSAGASGPAVEAAVTPSLPPAATATQPSMPTGAAQATATAELDGLFWQSVMNSTNPAEFEAYLEQFPNGVFRALAQARLTALRTSPTGVPTATEPRGGAGSPAAVSRVSGVPAPALGSVAVGDARRRPA